MWLFGKKRKSSQWPAAVAKIDEVWADEHRVCGSGAYTVNGEYYSIIIEKEFSSSRAAQAWVAQIEANPNVTVRYNPADPSENVIEEPQGS